MGVAVITGANRGIGLELVRQLVDRGEEVVAVCRKKSPELENLSVTTVDSVDVTQQADLERLATFFSGKQISLLVNNAGILSQESVEDLNVERIRQQFEVNALAPLRLTTQLLPAFGPNGKVVLVTSRMGSIADNSSGSRYGYRMSKAALNMAGVSLAHDLRPRGIAVGILHPGFVRTEMTGFNGMIDVQESAQGLLKRIDALTLETSGLFFHVNGEPLPW